ncbi:MAG: M23 family metallopeptidase [Acidobacteria bacterium]|nr:M23 family metallopeptidase [Acidobacteriota bacterium]
MASRRYTIELTDPTSGVVRRFTIPLRPALVAVAVACAIPMLIGMGARWSARAVIQDLETANTILEMENASYRQTTDQLASQISELQTVVDDLGVQAIVDPAASRAMERLPAGVKSRAMGGGMGGAAAATMPHGALDSFDQTFGALREVLGAIESRLTVVRTGVERRQALAAATPSIWPVAGYLSSGYGTRRDPFTGDADFHSGLDIAAPQGQPVQATADGVVVTAAYNGNYGNFIELDHGFGITTRYGHLSRYQVVKGQRVQRGDVIGAVGSTGRSTSPHLHYEVFVNGRMTNPLRLLTTR